MELQSEKKKLDSEIKRLDAELERTKALIVADMGTSCRATYEDLSGSYLITFKPSKRPVILKNDLERMKAIDPEIYTKYVTISESRRFNIKKLKEDAA